MDAVLEQFWRIGKKPFELTLYSDDLLPISELRNILSEVVAILNKAYLNEPIYYFEDWHEHDGYITSNSKTSWEEIARITSSEYILYTERNADDHVRRAYYPELLEFLLRFRLLDEDDDKKFYPGKWGDFDVTSSPVIIKLIRSHLTPPVAEKLTTSTAKDYFQKRYAG